MSNKKMSEADLEEQRLNCLAEMFLKRGPDFLWRRMCKKRGSEWVQDMRRRIRKLKQKQREV